MDWKKFLKPTPEKIVLAIVILISSFLFLQLNTHYLLVAPASEFQIQFERFKEFFSPIFLPLGIISFILLSVLYLSAGLGYFAYVTELIYLYLISCFIFWIYDKFRKK